MTRLSSVRDGLGLPLPRPLMPQFEPRGISHQRRADSDFILSTDEDFSPFPTSSRWPAGRTQVTFGAGSSASPVRSQRADGHIGGPTVFGGRGCLPRPERGPHAVGDPAPPPASAIPPPPARKRRSCSPEAAASSPPRSLPARISATTSSSSARATAARATACCPTASSAAGRDTTTTSRSRRSASATAPCT